MSLSHAGGLGSSALDKPQGVRVEEGSSSKAMSAEEVC